MLASASSRPESEQIKLTVERRIFLKRRWRGVAEDGTEFGFDLDSRLKNGCVFFQADSRDYIISQIPEAVYELPIETPEQGALIGWRIGNLHFAVEILAHCLRVTNDPAIKQLLEREGWPHTEREVVFTPLRVITHGP